MNIDFSEETIIFTKIKVPTQSSHGSLGLFKQKIKPYRPAHTVTQTPKGLTC